MPFAPSAGSSLTPAMTRYQPQEFRPGPDVESDAALEEAIGKIATTIFHPVGTAAMGRDEQAVVTPDRLAPEDARASIRSARHRARKLPSPCTWFASVWICHMIRGRATLPGATKIAPCALSTWGGHVPRQVAAMTSRGE
jgi:hypothetical protein